MRAVRNDLRIEYVGVETLRPDPNNARTHSKKQIRQIARSIEEFGFVNGILVDDSLQVIAGHGRLLATKLLGMDHRSDRPPLPPYAQAAAGLCARRQPTSPVPGGIPTSWRWNSGA